MKVLKLKGRKQWHIKFANLPYNDTWSFCRIFDIATKKSEEEIYSEEKHGALLCTACVTSAYKQGKILIKEKI